MTKLGRGWLLSQGNNGYHRAVNKSITEITMTGTFLTTSMTPELCCSNFKSSLSFYVELLGFKIQYQREHEGFAMLERQGSRIMLDEIRANTVMGNKRVWITAPMERPFGRGINLEIKTTQVEQLYQVCEESEATIFLPIEDKWYRAGNVEIGNRQFIVLDPDGYMLRFVGELGVRHLSE
ncbi:bleomycin resistance protein [Legionella quateirensis]|uniref:Bleomycin resistance protein n=1 Tax=Legionella quateirensis TaxID=45072 RepID=A0A378KXU5_9GAMM|nr:VOC family protein [Legionella quateirensis]KTD47767.1 Glyoxalase-like domain protein [Legionella quateirensis]STY16660.1 Glyoxalase-like domain [Legionella quateirensis]